MADKARFVVRIGEHYFKAEGPVELVRTRFDKFLEVVRGSDAALTTTLETSVIERSFVPKVGFGLNFRVPTFRPEEGEGGLDMRTNFAMLLLYSALVFDKKADLSATELIALLKKASPLADEERLDRTLAGNTGLIVKSGIKRGSRYGLTQSGVNHVEKLLRARSGKLNPFRKKE